VDVNALASTGSASTGGNASALQQRVDALEAEVAQLRATVQMLCESLGVEPPAARLNKSRQKLIAASVYPVSAGGLFHYKRPARPKTGARHARSRQAQPLRGCSSLGFPAICRNPDSQKKNVRATNLQHLQETTHGLGIHP
jgi:hypothetical protein